MSASALKTARLVFRVVCAGILVLAFIQVIFINPAKSSETASEPQTTVAEHGGLATEQVPSAVAPPATETNVVTELENRKVALDARARELDEQEHRLKDREKELDKKLKEMEHLRAEVTGELESQRKNNEERVLKMVGVFESMSPKAASGVLETLDDWLAVEVLKRMDTKRVAKIMNQMDKNRSAKLSELLTGYYNPSADRKVSSIKPAGQAVADAKAVTAPAQTQSPAVVDSKRKGGE